MFEILKYLAKNSFQTIINTEIQELNFQFSNDNSIIVSYTDYFEDEIFCTDVTDELLSKVNDSHIKNISIVHTEYIGYREDILDYTEPVSQSLRLFEYLKRLNKYNTDLVKSYKIIDDYNYDNCYGLGCPNEPNYGFIISINRNFWKNKESYKFIINDLDCDTQTPPMFLWRSYKNYKKELYDSGIIKILITNTKVRRLGYFNVLAKYFRTFKKASFSIFNRKFESYALVYSNSLQEYKNNKGEIKITNTGNSASHYTKLALGLNLLNLTNNVLTEGKTFKVYQILDNQFNTNGNIFELSNLDKLFFLESLLKEDFIYLSYLLELIFIKVKTNYKELNAEFHPFLIQRLNELESKEPIINNRSLNAKLLSIKERIKKWDKPNIYLEHVLMPRINWLFDLNLVNLDQKNNITLTKHGTKLFYNICYLTDLKQDRIINFNYALEAFFIHIFDDIYFDSKFRKVSIDDVNEKISGYIIESFHYFKTLAPNRVTSSQAIQYTKYKLYLVDKIKVDYSYINKQLKEGVWKQFIYKYQSKYKDGYIQIRKL